MKITYLGHSGFLLEWETCYWIFDYYKGEIPKLDSKKKIFVFSSHKHADHYNPMIFELSLQYPDLEYILSSDIHPRKEIFADIKAPQEILNHITSVKPTALYSFFDQKGERIALTTLKSTDCGVAFLLEYLGRTIYHAGDLNLWVWKGESKQYNNNMTAKFMTEMNRIKDINIDIAFAPLDPRLEDWYDRGLECLLNTAQIKVVFPMHFWDKPSVIRQFIREKAESIRDTQVMEMKEDGQSWELMI